MRAWVLYYASRKQNDVSKNCAPIIHILFGRGFESGRELPYDVVMKMILDSLVLGVVPDKKNLAIAFAYWFAYYLPEDMVMVDCKGRLGMEIVYDRNVNISICVAPVLGLHMARDMSGNLLARYYRYGLLQTIMPEIGISYRF